MTQAMESLVREECPAFRAVILMATWECVPPILSSTFGAKRSGRSVQRSRPPSRAGTTSNGKRVLDIFERLEVTRHERTNSVN
jgi:hypothetical protein